MKGPLIIFEKDKGMTNANGNVDSNSYINHILPRLVEFYDEVRTHLQKHEGDFSVTDLLKAEYQPLLQDNAVLQITEARRGDPLTSTSLTSRAEVYLRIRKLHPKPWCSGGKINCTCITYNFGLCC
jgi:hypothetical protein